MEKSTGRPLDENVYPNKKPTEKNTESAQDTESCENTKQKEKAQQKTEEFNPFAYLEAIRMTQTEAQNRTGTPNHAPQPQETCSDEIQLDEIRFSEENESITEEYSHIPVKKTFSDIFDITNNSNQNHTLSQVSSTCHHEVDSSFVSTQMPTVSIESKIQQIKDQIKEVYTYIPIREIRESTLLKIEGAVIGYIVRQSPEDRAGSLVITDGTDEISCAVSGEAQDIFKLEKDSVILISHPSVWRIPYAEETCVLNVVPDNIIFPKRKY